MRSRKHRRYAPAARELRIRLRRGKPLCRRCSKTVKPPRRTFCSKKCVDRWNLDRNPRKQRKVVFARDRGICCKCGTDTERLRELWRLALRWCWHVATSEFYTGLPGSLVKHYLAAAEAVRRDVAAEQRHYGMVGARLTIWDMDHIVEVDRGGGGRFRLRNMQTLCVPCHKEKSARYLRHRSWLRRLGNQLMAAGREEKERIMFSRLCGWVAAHAPKQTVNNVRGGRVTVVAS